MFNIHMKVKLELQNGDLCGLVGFLVNEHQFIYVVKNTEQAYDIFEVEKDGQNIIMEQLTKFCPKMPNLKYIAMRLVQTLYLEFNEKLMTITEGIKMDQNRLSANN